MIIYYDHDYWDSAIKQYETEYAFSNVPDEKHGRWKFREFLKLGRILNAEIKAIKRMEDLA